MDAIAKFGKLLYRGWMKFAHALGWVNTRILLSLFFFLIITPVAVAMRLLGKDILDQRLDPGTETYWIPKQQPPFEPQSYLRQF